MSGFARIRRFVRDGRGSVATMYALTLPVVVGFVALGTEVAVWYGQDRHAQAAADAAALSGALARATGSSDSEIVARAHAAANAAKVDPTVDTVTVNVPPSSGHHLTDPTAVEVIVSRKQNLAFASLFIEEAYVTSRSVGVAGKKNEYCVVGLDTVNSGAVTVAGKGQLDSPNCAVAANSTHASSFYAEGSAVTSASGISSSGGIDTGSSIVNVPVKLDHQQPVADPYASLSVPTVSGCDHNSLSVGKNTPMPLQPGTYCNGLSVAGGANASFAPGVYVISGGQFKIEGGATLSGTDVTFVLTGSGGNYATTYIAGGADVKLHAPTTGPWAGVLFYQDPKAPSGGINYLQGGSTSSFQGAVYFPSQALSFSGGNTTSGSCIQLVARKVVVAGSSKLGNDCENKGVRMIGRWRPGLVE